LQDAQPQIVVVENPKTVDDKGKLVILITSNKRMNCGVRVRFDCVYIFSFYVYDPGEERRSWRHFMEKMTKKVLLALSPGGGGGGGVWG
jgi:hypothetical protein